MESMAEGGQLVSQEGSEQRETPPEPTSHTLTDAIVSKAKKKVVQDIREWSQCFAVYVAVLAKKSPETVPDLMAYLLLII